MDLLPLLYLLFYKDALKERSAILELYKKGAAVFTEAPFALYGFNFDKVRIAGMTVDLSTGKNHIISLFEV